MASDRTRQVLAAIEAERKKQIRKWGNAHDDDHVFGFLRLAAASLAVSGTDGRILHPDGEPGENFDPFGLTAKHGEDRKHSLVVAAALLVAELERLMRAEEASSPKEPPRYRNPDSPLDRQIANLLRKEPPEGGAGKISPAQSTLLRLIDQGCFMEGAVWIPPLGGCESLDGETILVTGSGCAGAYKALVRKGLITEHTLARYAAQITPAGKVAAEAEEGKPLTWVYRRPMGFEE